MIGPKEVTIPLVAGRVKVKRVTGSRAVFRNYPGKQEKHSERRSHPSKPFRASRVGLIPSRAMSERSK